jgi:ATP-binding cassette, subfamily B, multidrug efflux pump
MAPGFGAKLSYTVPIRLWSRQEETAVVFGRFERLIDPYPREVMAGPPRSMGAFLGWFVRRTWPLLVSISLLGATLAVAEVSVFWFMGTLIDWLAHSRPQTFFAQHGVTLAWIVAAYVLILPAVQFGWQLCFNQAIFGNFPMLARWRMHTYLLRQSLAFFQNDMAGRLAQTVMQTALATRESVTKIIDILVYVAVYFVAAVLLVAKSDLRLALPLVGWLGAYALIGWYFVPKLKAVSQAQAEARAVMTGRVVDSYTNILTVKLFSHTDGEVAYAQGAMRDFMVTVHRQNRLSTRLSMSLFAMNYGLLVAMAGLCIEQWQAGHVTPGAVAVSIALVQRLQGMSQWILWEVSAFFEAVGTVADGVETLGRPLAVTDRSDSKPLTITKGEVRFEHVAFHYGRAGGVLEDLSLVIPPQQRLGLVGPSGAGKSTITSLLLRLFDVEGGVIAIDGQDIAQAAQESLRAQIGVVTQDTSLLHRSIAENIRYGRPGASFEDVVTAAQRAHAHAFIMGLQDAKGRTGYDAHVGERGVNLSGGQRQRIAIARVLLKDAPILVLDEATSALDSEIESAIQESLSELMRGKTVIAIAHRLSTIARMDRLLVLDEGRIVEDGPHALLVGAGGLYARLWSRQTDGFMPDEVVAAE